ncbi:MAG: hypothetical protein OJF49_000844 [Ktedonobacterales bacterium]|jgi:hypothetical protein|nr:MAG: hypothetical protein OJF49_000844 [Ktedonobacterales bacterium]
MRCSVGHAESEAQVAQWEKLLRQVLSGKADANIPFDGLCGLLARLGYIQSIRGDHHIFRKRGQPEIVNIQPLRDGKAKPFEVRQIRKLLQKYGQTKIS